ncbi:sodium-dependent transporter [Spelaeicoccus albus]|uniref:Transporter n=1 Tax=Spelaeicoccus albus TaxID=1280376 RepID=A0A7Z0D4B8_9MICO|nr:sodium-dependent transporter [Spelaeicoccus albus]NYI68637.1 NSS family neurotransmitter:Na+ symporter [Spelaeicoccus albus]
MAAQRETFTRRSSFIFAAVGSAIGLGNIWRFPYVAYDSGGGAFIIPYLVALSTAGIPLLFMYYALGHRFRASPPLTFRRISGRGEMIGWWQVGISIVIAVYYAAVIAWALRYAGFSVTKAWGDDPADFFGGAFLQQDATAGVSFDYVPGVLIPLAVIWCGVLVVLGLGVQKGIARANMIFIPLLVVVFLIIVVRSLFLDGAARGLDALFSPDWGALSSGSVWVAAYGQIFFSLSIGFGIMITYSSYLKRRTNLTASGLVVGLSNSAFEILAGIGVFAALGFMATTAGQPVSEVVDSGVGLAFIAFPAIISEMPGGAWFGVLFFGSIVVAGFTSLISIVEVVVSSLRDKTAMSRNRAVWSIGGVLAIISLALFSTTTSLNLLDVTDAFINNFGIVGAALLAVLVLGWGVRKLPELRDHLNGVSSFTVNRTWRVFVSVVTPILLGYMFIKEVVDRITEGYGDMPAWFVNTFGWGVGIGIIVLAWLVSLIPWKRDVDDEFEPVKVGENV